MTTDPHNGERPYNEEDSFDMKPELKKKYTGVKKILHLTLKKQWFDMIASGEKKEDYREMKIYWAERLVTKIMCNTLLGYLSDIEDTVVFRKFDAVEFTNGYGKKRPKIMLECNGISIGVGKAEWGADDWQEYFIIKLGNII